MRLVLMILAEGQLSEQEAGKEVEVVARGPGAEVVWQKFEFEEQAERMAGVLLSVLRPIGMPPSATSLRTSFSSSSLPLTCGRHAL